MVNKPGKKKGRELNLGFIAAVVVVVFLAGAVGWYVYSAYLSGPATIRARVVTTLGTFDIELYPTSANKTVANFVQLAKSGFFNNLVWHRIVSGFVVQTGDPNSRGGLNGARSTWGLGSSNKSVPFEYDPGLHNYRGYIAMASTVSKRGGTSQFYINLVDNPDLDGKYAVFGKVLNDSGMDVVDAIANVPVYTPAQAGTNAYLVDQPVTPVFVVSITILDGTK